MTSPTRIAVLASGRGSNLAALIAARDAGTLPVEFALVASDKADAGALRLAEAAGIPTLALSPKAYPDRRAYDLDLFGRVAASGAHPGAVAESLSRSPRLRPGPVRPRCRQRC